MPRSPAQNHAPSRQPRIILLATDNKNSVLAELTGGQPNPIAYSAYGQRPAQQEITTHLGFNGELCENNINWYLLGKGYRAYNPALMRFHSPDSLSPFGKGGLNAYMYCVGDPVNFSDPTGHIRFWKSLVSTSSSVTRTPSSSSLTPLISDTAQGITNPNFVNNVPTPKPTYKTIPALTRNTQTHIQTQTHIKVQTPTGVTNRRFVDYGPWRGTPLQIPSRQKPRFNDIGGQVGILSPNQIPGEPPRYREVWKSQPFESPPASVPPTRALPSGATRHYSVRYDDHGNPTQSSVEKISLSLSTIRKTP